MLRQRILSGLSLACSLAVVILTTICVILYFFPQESDQIRGTLCFLFFTTDSNLLAAIAALCLIPIQVSNLIRGRSELPLWAVLLKYLGTVSVTVTFLTVVFFLAPKMGIELLISGKSLFLHTVCPLLSILSFCLLETGRRLPFPVTFLSVLPTVIYGWIYVALVVFTGMFPDVYGFNVGGYWYISLSVMTAATYGMGTGLWALHRLFHRLLYKGDGAGTKTGRHAAS